MLFWVLVALLTAATTLALAWPLLRPPAASSPQPASGAGADPTLGVYRDQLAEVDRDVRLGLIGEDQAKAVRVEVARRLLAADRMVAGARPAIAGTDGSPLSTDAATGTRPGTRWLALILAIAVPVAALAVYLPLGRPDLPSQPLASRDLAHEGIPGGVKAAVARLAQVLQTHPDDLEGWLLLGRSYAKMGRYADGADAMRHAVALAPDNTIVRSAFGEALTAAANGIVGDEARQAFATVLAHNPHDARARYYLALAREQAGDVKGALDGWTALAADSPADAPWLPALRNDIRQAAQTLHLDPDKVMPQPKAAPPAAASTGEPGGPSNADMAAAASLSPAQRSQMINSMVAGLAARLHDHPDDVDGWMRLGHAYTVLGQPAAATDALDHAIHLAPGRADVLAAYGEALLAGGDRTVAASPRFLGIMHRLIAIDPNNRQALWYLGLDAAATHPTEAATLWKRLLTRLQPGTPDYKAVSSRLAGLPKTGD